MYKAFRTNTEEILKMESSIKSTDIDKLKSLQKDFKQKIRPFILPKDDIINGETLKDTYFPTSKDGKPYDIFISHSHNNQREAEILAAWLTKHKGLSCFVDSFVWGSADELLKEIDNKYCKNFRKNTYDYTKRNFTTSHVHAIYNPQNEMFSHSGMKRYNFKNETQLFKVIPHTSKNQKKSTGFAGTKYI